MAGQVFKYSTSKGVRWGYGIELSPDPATGTRRRQNRKGFATRREADEALHVALGQVKAGTHVEHDRLTVATYLQQWVAGIRVKPTTRANYETCINVHLVPVKARDGRTRPGVGGLRLQDLRPEHLDVLYRWLEVEGKQTKTGGAPLAVKSVRHVHTCIRKALQDAVERGHVGRNVADLSHPPSQKQARSRRALDGVWTAGQLQAFLAAAEGDDLYALFLLACTTGMRRAELLGLRWADVDLEARRLRVRWTVTEARGKPVEQDSAKTDAGERTIAIDETTAAALRAHRLAQLEQRVFVGSAWEDQVGRVFVNPVGRLLVPRTVLDRLRRIGRRIDLPPIDIHGLRHSYATAALRAGVKVEVLSERIGHADPGITLLVYRHVLDGEDAEAAEVAARAILG